ncbi:hypothetical protein [Bacillus mycoides]|uniref:hypothetical protein n=1 Tax=Bacillus mycoides TaxID=1405 RepID=UPI001F139AD7|nr:hypothetical protein [Bacillus mycoides]
MSFFTEFINYFKTSGISIVMLITTLLSMILAIFLNFIQTKFSEGEIDSELDSTFKGIVNQRNVTRVKLKLIESIHNHIVSVTTIMIFSKHSKKKSKKRKSQKIEESNKNRLIISALFLESKLKKIYKAYFIIGFGSILLLGISYYFNIPSYIYIIPLLFAILTCSYQFLLNYRIKNGLFGTNDYEAKELIEFIIQNNDKINGNKIFNEEVISKTIIDFSNYVKKVHLLNEH